MNDTAPDDRAAIVAESQSRVHADAKPATGPLAKTRRRVLGRHLPSRMQWAVLSWALSLAILAGGAWAVCPDGQCALTDFDRIGLSLAHDLRSDVLDRLMEGVTWLGSLVLLLPLTGLAAWVLFRGGRRRVAGFIVLALLGSSALSHLVKLWVTRPRPDLFPAWSTMPEDWSYPSAHAMQATAAALALGLVVARRRSPWALAVLLTAAVLLVGLSRIYLQVHFPSDVLAGALAAVFWVLGLYALMLQRKMAGDVVKERGDAA